MTARIAEGGHAPVLLDRAVAALAPRAGRILVDATFGGGGYSTALLDAADCRVLALDRDAVLAAAAETGGVVTAEEHRLTGGLGGAVAELLAEERPTPMRFVGMPAEYAVVGPTARVRDRHGMSARHIVAACLSLAG